MMKKTAITLAMLMLVSVFAMAFALADDSTTFEDVVASETVETSEGVVETPIADQNTVQEVASEVETVAPSEQASVAQQRYAGIARLTVGDGYVIKSDSTAAEKLRGFWVSARYISVDPAKVKEIRDLYKGQPAKIREELAKLATDKVVLKATGRIAVGLGAGTEKFKILKKEFTNTSARFYVLPITEDLGALKDATDADISAKAVGELQMSATKYPHLTVWQGTLTLNSGNFAGTWTVSLSTHLRLAAKKLFGQLKVSKPSGGEAKPGQIEAGKQAGQAGQPAIKPQAAARKPLLQRLIFWRKAAGAA